MSEFHPILMLIIIVLGCVSVFALKKIEDLEKSLEALNECYHSAEEHLCVLMEENEKLKQQIAENESVKN